MSDLTQLITKELLFVASVIKERTGNAALTGSTPLACLLKGLSLDMNWEPGDIDLFVPCHLAVASCFNGNYNNTLFQEEEFSCESLETLLDDLEGLDNALFFGDVIEMDTEYNFNKEHNPDYPLSGIRHIYEFTFSRNENFTNAIKVQVIAVERYPLYEGQSFEECIVNSFDLDIVRGVMLIPENINFRDGRDLTHLLVWYPNNNIVQNIEQQKYICTIRPYNTLEGIKKRCLKYCERGFMLLQFLEESEPVCASTSDTAITLRIPWIIEQNSHAVENMCISIVDP